MSLKDKMEVGLKPDAPYRQDNLPEIQQDDPDCQEAAEPGNSARAEEAREDCSKPAEAPARPARRRVARAAGDESLPRRRKIS